MRVSINKLTGRLIESQSGGDMPPINPDWTPEELNAAIAAYRAANLQTLIDNAVRQGHKAEEIEAKFIPYKDLPALIEASKMPEQIAAEAAQAAYIAAKTKAIADGLPDWSKVEREIKTAFPDIKQQTVILKLARVIYLDVKNSVD